MKHSPPPSWLTERPIAHRGLHKAGTDKVENTIPAIKAAIEAGYAIEVDVQLTKDKGVVVIHDRTLERLTGISGYLPDMMLDEVTAIEVTGSNSCIPTLQELLDLVDSQVPLFIELKVIREDDPKALPAAMIDTLRAYKGPLAVMSFHPLAIKWFRGNAPDIVRGMVLEKSSSRFRFNMGLRRTKYCKIAGAQFVAHDIKSLPNRFSKRWRKAGKPLVSWTVNTKELEARAAKHADQPIFEIPAVVGA